jgi:uncharacterized protein
MSSDAIPEIQLPPPEPRDPAWGYRELLLILLAFFLSLLVCAGIGIVIARFLPAFQGMDTQQISLNPLFFVPAQFCAYLLTFIITRMLITVRAQQDFWKALRWEMPAFEVRVVLAFSGVLLAMAVQFAGSLLPMPKGLPIQQYFREPQFAYIMAAFGLLIAPLIEEVFFRGLLFPVVARTAGITAAIVVTSALFSLLHQSQLAGAWAPLLLIFFVGMVITLVRARTNSVAASWIVHLFYNGTLFGTLFYATQGFKNMGK